MVGGGKVRDGKGILLTEHSHFEGEFENNQKKAGYELRTNGIYKGEFQQNKRGGKGEFIWFNGEYYNGEWLDNQKHGSGIWTSSYTQANPDTYIGEWKHGKVDGYGVHTWSILLIIQKIEPINTRENSSITSSTAKGWKGSRMEINTRGSTGMEDQKGMVSISGQTDHTTRGIFTMG